MEFDFNASPEGHVYCHDNGPGPTVRVYRTSRRPDGTRFPGRINVRQDRTLFLAEERRNWTAWGYINMGTLVVPDCDDNALVAALDALVSVMDRDHSRLPLPPLNADPLNRARRFLRDLSVHSVFIDAAPPSAYQWD